jgi:N-acetylglutamate synthase-like GNAT family acetyltransferase
MHVVRAQPDDVDEVRRFLSDADLTLAGLESRSVHIWVERDGHGSIVGTTGWEASADGRHALIRSLAVAPDRRGAGAGSRLARHALADAASHGASCAWLFSRRSGPFWRTLGFVPVDRDELAAALAGTHQVRLFRATGQLTQEVAWTLPLVDIGTASPVALSGRDRLADQPDETIDDPSA